MSNSCTNPGNSRGSSAFSSRLLSTWALFGAVLRLGPDAAVVALLCAGLPRVWEAPGLRHLIVHHHYQHLLLLLGPLLLLHLQLLLPGQRRLHRAWAEHGEVRQAAVLVHQPDKYMRSYYAQRHWQMYNLTHIWVTILVRTFIIIFKGTKFEL